MAEDKKDDEKKAAKKPTVREVTNNTERQINLQLPPPEKSDEEKKADDAARAAGRAVPISLDLPLRLMPGLNLVPVEVWERAKKNQLGAPLLMKTKIEPSPAPEANPENVGKMMLVEGQELDAASPLKALSTDAARERVKEMLDGATLRAWMKDEARAEVRRAIEKQIEAIEASGETNDGDKRPPRAGRRGGNGGGATE